MTLTGNTQQVAAVAYFSFLVFHFSFPEHGCQRFIEPVLSPLLYKITPYVKEVIRSAKLCCHWEKSNSGGR